MTQKAAWITALVLTFTFVTATAGPAPKVGVCHVPLEDPGNFHTIWISENALESHLAHGDAAAPCEDQTSNDLCEYTVQMCVWSDANPDLRETSYVSLCDVPAARAAGALDGHCECYGCQKDLLFGIAQVPVCVDGCEINPSFCDDPYSLQCTLDGDETVCYCIDLVQGSCQ